jgi:hypothetical protein
MEAMARVDLESALKDTTLAVLGELVKHNVKGAELMQQGFLQLMDIKDEVTKWYDILKQLLTLLKPVFEVVREWLVSAYHHLVAVFDWAKEMWHKIFG